MSQASLQTEETFMGQQYTHTHIHTHTHTHTHIHLETQETADLATFTEEILNGKLHFLCRVVDDCAISSISDNVKI